MKTQEIQQLLAAYFKGETSLEEERKLEAYFRMGNIAKEVAEYAEFFAGISELADTNDDESIEEDVMDYILENEHREKTKYRSMWKMVTGIAASIIIVLGSFLVYHAQQKPFNDSFDNPQEAYAYATKTLSFVSQKYSKGIAQLSKFDMLHKANNPVKKSTDIVMEFYNGVERMKSTNPQPQLTKEDSL